MKQIRNSRCVFDITYQCVKETSDLSQIAIRVPDNNVGNFEWKQCFIDVTVVKHISHSFIIRQKVFVETVFERGGAAAVFGL